MIAVIGATGNIGKALTHLLLSQGHEVRAIARASDKLSALAKAGAEVYAGDVEDVAFLSKAMTGATAVFSLIPPKYDSADFRGYQNIVGDAIARAISKSGVSKVVNLSSIGAHLETGTGPILGLGDHERRLNALPLSELVHLRPAYFYENVFFGLSTIKDHGIFGTPISKDVSFPQIATVDIAKVAADLLVTKSESSGIRVVEIAGPKDLSMTAVTEELRSVFGLASLPYVEFAPSDAKSAMVQSGLAVDVADRFLEMYAAINRDHLKAAGKVVRTATTFEAFAKSALA